MTLESDGHRIETLLRDLAPRAVGAVVRRWRDFAIAEDGVQDALLAAATQWHREGVPENPLAWLIQVASRRVQDQWRSQQSRQRRETRVHREASMEKPVVPPPDSNESTERDDTLILLFMCCHPALSPSSAIALTLRAVGGLTTPEIARAFLVPEATMAQRISRAKQQIRKSGVAFRPPSRRDRAERLALVLHVLYLIFNEGYASTSGEDVHRVELSAEAIRLLRSLMRLLPDDPEVTGLLALMLLTDARRAARMGAHGDVIPLDQQDRSLWDRAAIDEGRALVTRALSKGAVGPYQVQAAIAALHDEAAGVDETDWPQILALYGVLRRMADNPMVELSHAIAHAMVHGPVAGLELLKALDADERIAGSYRLQAAQAHLLERAGDTAAAVEAYRKAAAATASLPERNYLMMKAARLTDRAQNPKP